ncbi:ferric reductase NAD binding domain-containing protein [Lentinula lateritia]|uniref:Ferric reductase NAD binding domain-containing protein n=1 Tax=Lentinula aff. lateritia TaxID=2804960 RepID=A0ACC1UF44_9AGAR|nr:ferric reductase NAD binding domain-containing protein [Lentinula aff. lateritia]KAJ3857909.1 ferric reductase NAD binding domain-containing protein [Lentinula lateritia]
MTSLSTTGASESAVPLNADKAIRIQRANEYPHEVWFFLACLIALVAMSRLLSFVCSKVLKHNGLSSQDPERSSTHSKAVVNFRNLPLALVNIFRVVAFRFTLDFGSYSLNLTEVILTLMYMAALFTWTFINTTNVSGGKFDVSYWSNRAGALIASQIPLITALGTKNNIITFITGVSYEKLNYLHRMAARVVFVLVWVHAGAKVSSKDPDGLDQTWLRCGILAASSLTSLCIISVRPVRSRAYEFFFYTHLVLVLLFLVGAYRHSEEFSYQTYVWPSFVIWGVDRIVRVFRLVVFNHSYFGFGSGAGTALDATTELLTPKCVRLTLKRPLHFKWAPGQVAYLITPGVSSLPFESHPFTIASYDSQMNLKEITPSVASTDSDLNSTPTTSSYWKELVFLINVQEGFTKRLGDIAAMKGSVKVYLDGPYGCSHNLNLHDTIVLIAGGTGVSHTLPILLDTIEGVRNGKSACKRVTFIWCIRDFRNINWISLVLAKALSITPDSLKVDVRIFVTGSDVPDLGYELPEATPSTSSVGCAQTPVSEKAPEPIAFGNQCDDLIENLPSLSSLAPFRSVTMMQGRPSLATLLQEEAEETRGGSMWVTVCGSQSIASAVRKGLQFPVAGPSTLLRGGATVSLHVESFGYA